ncbi:hypothetical protein [Vampirovibrio chlorellavorus]|uniref:hypothetical protein n=1 Tax=Vampirovibrio chlorellavorus TaxID=758823 RepID=UPI0026ECACB8|nr:hypothetical protein [Vampirovibrio chlorellavorus]
MNFPPAFPPSFPMPAPGQGFPPAAPQFSPAAPQLQMTPQPGFPMPFQSQSAFPPAASDMASFGAPGAMPSQPIMGQPQPAPRLTPGFNPAMPPQAMLGQQAQPQPGMSFPAPQPGMPFPQPGMMPPMGNGMSLNLLA